MLSSCVTAHSISRFPNTRHSTSVAATTLAVRRGPIHFLAADTATSAVLPKAVAALFTTS